MTYMNAKLFREYSTALDWTLSFFLPQVVYLTDI